MFKKELLEFIQNAIVNENNHKVKCTFNFFGGETEFTTNVINLLIEDYGLCFECDLTDQSEMTIKVDLSNIVSYEKLHNGFVIYYNDKEYIYIYFL